MTFTIGLNPDNVKMSQQAKYQTQKSLSEHTNTHTGQTALPGPLNPGDNRGWAMIRK